MSLSRPSPGSRRSNANAFVMPRYASRSSMRRHHRVLIGDDASGQPPDPTTGGSDVQKLATCTDAIVGRYNPIEYCIGPTAQNVKPIQRQGGSSEPATTANTN